MPPFSVVSDPAQLADAAKAFGYAAICKTATAGYDGKGQWPIRQPEEVALVESALRAMVPGGARWIVESLVEFERELSVLVVRGEDGEQRVYPVVENRHESGILRMTAVPAAVSAEVSVQASGLACRAVEIGRAHV